MDTATALRFLGDVHALDSHSSETFAVENMSPGARDRFVGARAREVIRESGAFPRFIQPPSDTAAAMELARSLVDGRPDSPRAALRESGVPVVKGQDAAATRPSTRVKRVERTWSRISEAAGFDESWRCLADSGVPMRRRGAALDRPEMSVAESLREAGIRTKEASAGSSAGALERSPNEGPQIGHRVVSALDQIVPQGHPDREVVNRLKRRGAALDRDEIEQAVTLAEQHAEALKGDGPRPGGINDPDVIGKRWPPDDQEDDEPEVRESARASLAGAGVPMRAAAR